MGDPEWIQATDPRCQAAQGGHDSYYEGILVGGAPVQRRKHDGSMLVKYKDVWANVHPLRTPGAFGVRFWEGACIDDGCVQVVDCGPGQQRRRCLACWRKREQED